MTNRTENTARHDEDVDEPRSGPRGCSAGDVPEAVHCIVAEFRREKAALEDAGRPTERAFERLVGNLIAAHLGVVPVALRADIHATLVEMCARDPTLRGVIDRMRAAAQR